MDDQEVPGVLGANASSEGHLANRREYSGPKRGSVLPTYSLNILLFRGADEGVHEQYLRSPVSVFRWLQQCGCCCA